MKKLILTSATLLLFGASIFACDGGKCGKKGDKKCDQKECVKDGHGDKKCTKADCKHDAKCEKNHGKNCTMKCKADADKQEVKPADTKPAETK